jgi:hypothetical protein
MDNKDSETFKAVMTLARGNFARKTSFRIGEIEGRNGLYIMLFDIESGDMIKDAPIVKILANIGFTVCELEKKCL